jgi:hypothetical protein
MLVVTDESELNWWLRRFAPRISLRLSPDFVEVISPQGVARSAAVLSLIRKGDRAVVAGIGDEPVADAAADRIPVFQANRSVLTVDDAAAQFLSVLLKRLPPSGAFIRPVVVVEGLPSLDDALGGQHVAIVTRALTACGAAAAVIRDVAA